MKSGKKRSGVPIFGNTRKNFKSNLILIVILVLKSIAVYYPTTDLNNWG